MPDRPTRPARPPRPARSASGSGRPSAPKPTFPAGAEPNLPRGVAREIRQHVRGRELAEEVSLALSLGGEAIDQDVPEAGLEFLEWAKAVAPRAPSIREALGVARYLVDDFRGALNELRTYRRLSGRADQDHLVADCLRGLGNPASEVGAVVGQLVASDAPADRKVEGLIVWASAVADTGDVSAALAVLRRADRGLLREASTEAVERFTYVQGDLADRHGDRDTAVRAFERLASLDEDPYEVAPRLRSLQG